jgi:Caspase domain
MAERTSRGSVVQGGGSMTGWLSRLAALTSIAAALLAFAAPAQAEKRVALVIGNNDYRYVPKLQKAVNDARTMGDTLKQLGFSVMVAENQNRQAFSETLLAFDKAVEPGDTAFFFYAGHGFEIAGQNFLLPTDVPAAGEGQEELVRDASVLADRVIERLQNKKVRTAILVFDACRNNPFERSGTRAVAGGGGLAPMTQLPEGVFSVFSAGPRQTALDRLSNNDDNPNSVFTRTFAKELLQPGENLVQVAQHTRRLVAEMAETVNHKQIPVYFDQMVDDVFLNGPAKGQPEAAKPPNPRRRSRRCRRHRCRARHRQTIPSMRRSRCSRAIMAAGPWCFRLPTRRWGFHGGSATPANSTRPDSSIRWIRAPASGCRIRRSNLPPMLRRPRFKCDTSMQQANCRGRSQSNSIRKRR